MLRKDWVPISTKMLQTKAVAVAEEQGVTEGLFTALPSWVKSFMRRHRLSIRARTRHGQTTPAEATVTYEAFAREVNYLVAKHGVADVFNCDQTGILFEYLPRTTVTKRGEKTVWVKSAGKDKERLTAMLLGDRAGNKYEPFIVLGTKTSKVPATAKENSRLRHGFGKRLWKEVRQLQASHNLQIYGNESAWWTGGLSVAFLDFHFGHRHWTEDPILLLWNDCSGHWVPEVVAKAKSLGILLKRIPPSFTYVCQPADLNWNRLLKCSIGFHQEICP
ncbi:hypothetical protein PR003_g6122 [Phytophthora rubi]|uniref:HTH CENPB-type domain-containing protein n=1 Tax=Phytophthora rubi TaxID=129364 RepID=A0A6A4FQU1_9STRA|nr:hypothetical protein PR002_g319 [Phytophthora rubi]KAE9348986.1 hypothetical protein PR003_g6122 [Phytophthora rubi]